MTWTAIPDSDIDPDSPVTTSLMTALRDNVAAFAVADSGAPKLVSAALDFAGPWEEIGTWDYSTSVASVEFQSIFSGYKEIKIVVEGMSHDTGAAGTPINFRWMIGATGQNSSIYHNIHTHLDSSPAEVLVYSSGTAHELSNGDMLATVAISSLLTILLPDDSSSYQRVSALHADPEGVTATEAAHRMYGTWKSNAAVDGIKFLVTTGNFTAGKIRIYGRIN